MAALQCAPAAAQEVPPPEERVGQVGAVAISLTEFEHWFAAATHSQFQQSMEFVAPGYERCTAAKRKLRAANGWRRLGGRELRARCARDHRMVRRQVMQFLVQSQWVEQEAAAVGVVVSERRVRQVFESQKRTAFPNERGYQRFLRESGASEADILYRIRLDTLQNRLTRHVTSHAEPVTAEDVARYRADHPDRYKNLSDGKANRKVRRQLQSASEQMTLGLFIEGFRKRYRALTWCADGYAIAECGAIAPPS
ncbi:MAG TPA: SurA N-terminal domain-containing protein [Thermoleophilaceae bacterium]|nr:SurA N-terminal domain-containing protein [Thermoleophilaceae bacterium]